MESAAPIPVSGSGVFQPPPSCVLPLDFGRLRAQVAAYLRPEDVGRIEAAYHFSADAHHGQVRKSGEPYISHPVAVAEILAGWHLDAQALCAALLHDVMEDTHITKAEISERFGRTTAELVDGVSKLDKIEFQSHEEAQAENFRKMLLAMASDLRVILIKLADRLHNMRTLDHMRPDKRRRIARETQEIHAPIANRLGLNSLYRELQELAFKHRYPMRFRVLSRAILAARGNRREVVGKILVAIEERLPQWNIEAEVRGREKHLYSIYRKMAEKRLSFSQVLDIYGFRVIVPDVQTCYRALGALHGLYKPVPGKFKDHIAIAKLNGYQSLHTTLVGPSGVNIEFQMRTEEMHLIAEAGVAAHWLYKAQDADGATAERLGTKWLQSLLDIQNETRDAAEFWDHVKVDLFPDAVYVFTPKSQIMALPRGATVVDFAYAIHSNIGNHTSGAKINNEQVPLRTELKNGDVVEIITTPTATPNPAWLGFVRSGRARSKIRHHLKTLAQTESESLGEKLLTQALRAEGLEQLPESDDATQTIWEKLLRFTGNRSRSELMTDIGLGKRIATIVAKRLMVLMSEHGHRPDALLMTRERYTSHETVSQGGVTLDGSEGASIKYAHCCRPIPGDSIVGYLGRGEGLVVHAAACAIANRLQNKDSERFITVDWAEEPTRMFETRIIVTVNNGKGVLARVAADLARSEADITHVDMDDETALDTIDLRFIIAVRDQTHLESALRNLRRTPAVLRAIRSLPQG